MGVLVPLAGLDLQSAVRRWLGPDAVLTSNGLVGSERGSKVIVSSKRQLELLPVAAVADGRAQPQRQLDWLDGLFDHREQFGGERVRVDLLAGTDDDCSTVRAVW
jgi:hypothetical protein